MVDFASLTDAGLVNRGLYLVTSLGHQAVMVFFVLSGYLVGGIVLRQSGQGKFSVRSYSADRLSRLWTVLIPALCFTWVVDNLVAVIDPSVAQGTYREMWASGPSAGAPSSTDQITFLGNVLFLQTIAVPTYGLNYPLWSLANEFWYYVVFPATVVGLAAVGRRAQPGRVGVTVVGCLVATFALLLMTPEIRWGLVVWLIGAASYELGRRVSANRIGPLWFSLPVFLAVLLFSASPLAGILPDVMMDLLLGLSFAWVLLSAVRQAPRRQSNIGGRLSGGLAKVSYTLYVFHFPLVVLIAVSFFGGNQLQPTVGSWTVYLAALLLIVVACWLVWYMFERQTPSVRGAFRRLFGGDVQKAHAGD